MIDKLGDKVDVVWWFADICRRSNDSPDFTYITRQSTLELRSYTAYSYGQVHT